MEKWKQEGPPTRGAFVGGQVDWSLVAVLSYGVARATGNTPGPQPVPRF